ncbi:MAG: glycoside hydrolase N-terminal domain-containing protein [Cyclobacteriaceae bacterium]
MNHLAKVPIVALSLFFMFSCASDEKSTENDLKLWYDEPAQVWTEALPIGNGRIGAMIYGGASQEHIQFNEETLWTGKPRNYSREGAVDYLDEIRQLLFDGKQDEAEELAGNHFMGRMSNEEDYPAQLSEWLDEVKSKENLKYAGVDFDDSDWKSVNVPNIDGWEPELQGLDGSVWLRFSFDLPENWSGKDLILNLGRIRDTDITYFNGTFISSDDNKFGRRRYPVSAKYLRKGKNVIAIQVLNFYDDGGMTGFKDDEPMVVYPKGGSFDEGIPLNVAWKYFVDNANPPEYPRYEAAYQPFGDVWLDFPNHAKVENYKRELKLTTATSSVTYTVDGVKYQREYFVSEPDQALIMRISASEKGALSFNASFSSPHVKHEISSEADNVLKLKAAVKNGALYGVSYLKAESVSGSIANKDGTIQVASADEVTLVLTAATNYLNYDDVSGEADKLAKNDLLALEGKSYDKILNTHIHDYQSYYNRFSINLGSSANENLTTDERIKQFGNSSDPALVALYVQYGRYLLLSSSRSGTRPANLQGVWNDQMTPPWDCKYTANINLEMNYWPVEVLNLSETHDPLFQMIKELSEQGAKTAKDHYDADGWVLHHNTDLWRATAPINNPNHGIWVSGGAWLCHHLWERYLFTQDEEFLKEAYPLMKGSAKFFVDFLTEDPKTGYLISTPSNSPENGGLVAGPTIDHQIIRDLFQNCIISAEILGVDPEFKQQLEVMYPRIAPNQIGQHGQLQEWLTDIDNPQNKHRHVSHLWGVYPGNEISWDTPELMEAAKQSLLFRGDEGTGWSLAWKLNLWARFRDGNHAWKMVESLLSPAWSTRSGRGGSYANLFDAHPPFQIDGNFGASAGIAEMIVQSQGDKLVLLPALPDALHEGKVSGLKARGGLTLHMEWYNSKMERLSIQSNATNQTVEIEYQGVLRSVTLENSERNQINLDLFN